MLKLNASYSKKVPAEGEYSSQSYHASIEVELPDGLSQDQLQGKIHDTFALVKNSVENELHSLGNEPPNGAKTPALGNGTAPAKTEEPASHKQLKYLLDLASGKGIGPQQLLGQFQLASLKQLTRQQCSKLIDELNGKVA